MSNPERLVNGNPNTETLRQTRLCEWYQCNKIKAEMKDDVLYIQPKKMKIFQYPSHLYGKTM